MGFILWVADPPGWTTSVPLYELASEIRVSAHFFQSVFPKPAIVFDIPAEVAMMRQTSFFFDQLFDTFDCISKLVALELLSAVFVSFESFAKPV